MVKISTGQGIMQQIENSNTAVYTPTPITTQQLRAVLNKTYNAASYPLTPKQAIKPKKTLEQRKAEDPMLQPIPIYPKVREVWFKQKQYGKYIQYLRLDSIVPSIGVDGNTYYSHLNRQYSIRKMFGDKSKIQETVKKVNIFHAEAFRISRIILTKDDLEGVNLIGDKPTFLFSRFRPDPESWSRDLGIEPEKDDTDWHTILLDQ